MDFLRRMAAYCVPSMHNDFEPLLLRRGALLFFLGLILVAEGLYLTTGGMPAEPAAIVASDLVSLTNEARARSNEGALRVNGVLTAAATAKAEDMAAKGYFSHTGPDGKLPWEWMVSAGYQYRRAGENLAVRFVNSEDVVDAWLNSPSHRNNVLKNDYTEIGIGTAQGMYEGALAVYIVQFFGSPSEASGVGWATPKSNGIVAAAETSLPSPSPTQTLERSLGRLLQNPQTANWVIGGTGFLLLLTLIFTFFVHIQIQPGRALMGGVAVAAFAFFLLAFNSRFLFVSNGQSAVVLESTHGVLIDQYGHFVSLEE